MPERTIGELPEYPVGSHFTNRAELSKSRVHRHNQKGITGGAGDSAESICLSDGYEDDEDLGDLIIYTGEGGRDPNTKKQVRDQQLTVGNAALKVSFDEQTPVRVVRGHQLKASWAPNSGYRYDGLYWVTKFWSQIGKHGFKIYRYQLEGAFPTATSESGQPGAPTRNPVTSNRIVRRAALAQKIKLDHDFTCQICGLRLNSPEGPFAEAAHIKPLGRPHNGPDIQENILCLCPNHHKLLDTGSIRINRDLEVIDFEDGSIVGTLNTISKHFKSTKYIEWHWNQWS